MSRSEGAVPAPGDGSPYGSRGLRINGSLTIPWDEIRWHATTAGGPGGQHANRRSTKVEVMFEAERSGVLGPRQRGRILRRLGPVVRAVAGESRSQARNRDLALQRLSKKIQSALKPPKRRIPTAPSVHARQRRLQEKREHSERKRRRRAPIED